MQASTMGVSSHLHAENMPIPSHLGGPLSSHQHLSSLNNLANHRAYLFWKVHLGGYLLERVLPHHAPQSSVFGIPKTPFLPIYLRPTWDMCTLSQTVIVRAWILPTYLVTSRSNNGERPSKASGDTMFARGASSGRDGPRPSDSQMGRGRVNQHIRTTLAKRTRYAWGAGELSPTQS